MLSQIQFSQNLSCKCHLDVDMSSMSTVQLIEATVLNIGRNIVTYTRTSFLLSLG